MTGIAVAVLAAAWGPTPAERAELTAAVAQVKALAAARARRPALSHLPGELDQDRAQVELFRVQVATAAGEWVGRVVPRVVVPRLSHFRG